jgi:hypothetical protein
MILFHREYRHIREEERVGWRKIQTKNLKFILFAKCYYDEYGRMRWTEHVARMKV